MGGFSRQMLKGLVSLETVLLRGKVEQFCTSR